MDTFWLVWNEAHGAPRVKHNTSDSAKREAERLARLNPGQRFHVLESVATCERNDVTWTEHCGTPIPF